MTDNLEKPQQKRRLPWRGIGIAFSTFAVIVVLYVLFAANFINLKYLKSNDSQQLQVKITSLEQDYKKISEEIREQNQIINTLRQSQTGFNRNEWKVMEAEFLTRLANQKLQFENNIPQAILLLKTADQHLRDLNDDKLISVRKALADDITNLEAASKLDMQGIYLRLSSLSEQIEKLALPNKAIVAPPTDQSTANPALPWWKQGLQQTWQSLQKIVIVRYNETGKLPLITPDQKIFLYQNLHALFENAQWGLLHRQPEVYRQSLQQASLWIKEYFLADNVKQTLLAGIEQLQQININPEMPKLSNSEQAFHDFFASNMQKGVNSP